MIMVLHALQIPCSDVTLQQLYQDILLNVPWRFGFITTLFPITVGVYKYSHLKQVSKLMLGLFIVSFLLDGLSNIITYSGGGNNLFIGPLWVVVSTIFYFAIYKIILKGIVPASVFNLVLVIYLIAVAFDSIFITELNTSNVFANVSNKIVLLVLVLLYFYKLARDMQVVKLERDPLFWFNVGCLIYSSGVLFILLYSRHALSISNAVASALWIVHAVLLYIVYNFCMTMALLLSSDPSKLLPQSEFN